MKRDPRLRDLSRDHHRALVLARRAAGSADGTDEAVAATWRTVRDEYAHHLAPHFDVEERCLLAPLELRGEEALVRRTRQEHEQLRALLNSSDGPRARLCAFADLLRAHVRFEERELFPAAEALLSPAELQRAATESAPTRPDRCNDEG